MEKKKKELLRKIAIEFPTLSEREKSYIAGYISGVEATKERKEKEVATA